MRLNSRRTASLGLALFAGTIFSAASASAQVTYDRLMNPEPANWLTNNRTYDAHRYSPLDQINTENAGNLDLAFVVPLAAHPLAGLGGGLHGTPLVDNGIMYFTDGVGTLYRIDLTQGDRGYINWIMDPGTDPEAGGIVNNRGAALLNDTVYTVTRDGFLTATDAGTGEVVWDVGMVQDPDEYFTAAPLALEDRIITGPAGDAPVRGRIEARSAETGDQLWQFWIIPGPGEPGHETWPDNDVYLAGASAIWTTGAYDPATHLLYWGTSNPTPFGDATLRPGDNLYSSSLLAINADDGQLAWYFQYTPNEQWDYDEIGSHWLFTVDGEQRVGHFGRNGFYYDFNAATGAFLTATQYVDQVTWTAGIDDKTGMPLEYDPALAAGGIQRYAVGAYAGDGAATEFCPNIQGGVNHWPVSYSDRTGLAYGAAIEGCEVNRLPSDLTTGSVVAMNADGQIAVKATTPFAPYGGVMSTGGGLVFSSTVNGDFFAMNDTTLDTLWNINLGSPIEAPPISYEVNGNQYVAVPVGTSNINNLFGGGGFPARGDDPNAASLRNIQRSWSLYFFAL